MYRAIQTSLLLFKRLNCVLISRCEYPSRNPTSPLDCRAADRFASPPPRPCLHYMLHFQPSPLAFLRKRTSTAQRHKCALQARENEARQADGRRRRVPERRRGGVSVFVGHRRTGWWICLFCGFGSGARITSHGTKPAFFHVIHRFVSPGVLTPVERGETEATGGAQLTERRHEYTRVSVHQLYRVDANKTALRSQM